MSYTWGSHTPDPVNIRPLGWFLVLLRGVPLVVLVFGGLLLLLIIRLFERPVFGQNRPITPYITQGVCRWAFIVMGIKFSSQGAVMLGQGAVVANHSSWLDIFALNARKRIYFVSKSEVAGWAGIGWLARATGTLFIRRDRREAKAQFHDIQNRLSLGHKLLMFPEGTSSDGQRVLPFNSTLFAAFLTLDLVADMRIQPVSVNYIAPKGQDERFFGWWGDMELVPHLLQVLAAFPQGRVELVYHTPLKAADYSDRKALARACEQTVRQGLVRAKV